MTSRVAGRAEDGFTLVEVLVAFTILALVLIAAYAGVSTSLHADRRAEFTRRAALLARSKLDELGLSGPIQIGSTSGTSDGLVWSLVVNSAPAGSGAGGLIGHWATIKVSAPGELRQSDRFTLTTLKLGPR